MGLSGWQSKMRGRDKYRINISQMSIEDYQTTAKVATVLSAAALAILLPELVAAIGADAAASSGAASAASRMPAWAIDALTNPKNYAKDSVDTAVKIARSVGFKPKLPFYDLPPGELPF